MYQCYILKIPININYTASGDAIASSLEQCNVTDILTSKKFIAKAKVNLSDKYNLIFFEDFSPSIIEKILYLLVSFLPSALLRLFYLPKNASSQELATIIFSSGSSGAPKGVQLSHANIVSNIEGLYQVFDIKHHNTQTLATRDGAMPKTCRKSFEKCLGSWKPTA